MPPTEIETTAALSCLRELFRSHGYTTAGLRAAWGPDVSAALERNNPAPAIRFVTRHPENPPVVLAGLFLLGLDVPTDVLDTAGLTDSGLLEALTCLREAVPAGEEGPVVAEVVASPAPSPGSAGGADPSTLAGNRRRPTVSSPVSIAPYEVPVGVPREAGAETVWLVSDHGTLARETPLRGDFVLGLGGAGRTLAEITPREPVDLAVDIGTGCGIQAVLLARHARKVVATDVSHRALQIAALTAALNGCDTIEFRHGSLLDPLENLRADLVVSNPPFVITPRTGAPVLEYRDGGATGDAIVRDLLAGLPAHLAEDGTAVLLANWENHDTGSGEDHDFGTERSPLDWITDEHTSALVVEREVLDPVTYAETWIRDGGVARASARWNADTTAWLDDFAGRNVGSISFGYVFLHRDTASGAVRRLERIATPPAANPAGLGAYLATMLAMTVWEGGTDDAALAATVFERSPDVTEARHFTPGQDQPSLITLEQGTGFGRSFTADAALAGFLSVADGTLSLGATASALAALLEVDEAALLQQLSAQVRELVRTGLVYPRC